MTENEKRQRRITIWVIVIIMIGCGVFSVVDWDGEEYDTNYNSTSSYSQSNSGSASYYDGSWTSSGGRYSIELNSKTMTAVVNWPMGKNVHCEWDVISANQGVAIGPCATVDYTNIFFILSPDGTLNSINSRTKERTYLTEMSRRK